MAAAVAVTPNPGQVGKNMNIAATGFAATHAITVVIEELGVTISGTTDGTGAFSTNVVTPQADTPLDVVTNDGTSTITTHVLVSTE